MKKLKLKVTQSQLDDIQYIQEQLNVRFYGDVDDYQEVQSFIDEYIDEANNMEKTIEYAYLVYSDNYTGNRKQNGIYTQNSSDHLFGRTNFGTPK